MEMIGIRKLRLYLETTVFNYYFDTDRDGHKDVVRLFEAIGTGLHEGYASEYVMAELKRAPEPKRSDMLTLVEKYGIRVIAPSLDAVHLAERYIKNGIIPKLLQYVRRILIFLHIAYSYPYKIFKYFMQATAISHCLSVCSTAATIEFKFG